MSKDMELTIAIIEVFDSLLDVYGIDIPSIDRDARIKNMTPEEIEGVHFPHIYGENYYYLERKIYGLIKENDSEKI